VKIRGFFLSQFSILHLISAFLGAALAGGVTVAVIAAQ
jgi:hypothetical protein